MIIISLLIWLIAVIIAITIHEFAHAFAADRLGDPTPSLEGRLSLNPLAHYDRVGSSMLLLSAVLNALTQSNSPVFGWAKPVPFDPYNLRDPKRDGAIIGAAGPIANILLAIIFGFILKTFLFEIPLLSFLMAKIIITNVSLAIFNLLPIFPLDGSHILQAILPEDLRQEYERIMSSYGIFILILLIMPWSGTSPISSLITPAINFILNYIL